jgi:hypothetical protein
MNMEVDQSGTHHQPGGVNPFGIRRSLKGQTNPGDSPIGYQDIGRSVESIGRIHHPPA